jgi:hypothetical protein
MGSLREARNDPVVNELPDHLRAFVTRHLDAMLSALADYELSGSVPLQKAVRDFVIDSVAHDSAVDDELKQATAPEKAAVKKASSAIGRAVEVVVSSGKVADALQKLISLADKAAEKGADVIAWIGGGPPSVS